MNASSPSLLQTMLSVLERLASTPAEQLSYLDRLGTPNSIDELALEFDDCFRPLQPLLLKSGAGEELSALNTLDEALGSDSLEWTRIALVQSSSWAQIRELAREAARLLAKEECEQT
jgi:hypothetical protein